MTRLEQAAPMLTQAGWDQADVSLLAGDASFRKYYRLKKPAGNTAILMDAPPPTEDVRPFVHIARHLLGLGLSAPEIWAEDAQNGFLLLEDLGDATFTRQLGAGKPEGPLYEAALDVLLALHALPTDQAAPAGLATYDSPRMIDEVCRLLDWYAPMMKVDLPQPAKAEFRDLWADALNNHPPDVPTSLALLDYHIDNLIDLPDRAGPARVGVLDFQDAVIAPVTYDMVSLIDDARRDVSAPTARALLTRYRDQGPPITSRNFTHSYALMGAQRHTRILGTFARLLVRDGKPGYLVHIPRVWRQLDQCLAHPELAALKAWTDHHFPASVRAVLP